MHQQHMTHHPIAPADITGLILAGGRGSRMGGLDKGLQGFNGTPLVQRTLMRLVPQVGTVMLNANRNLAAYAAFDTEVWPDATADFAGPLAGFLVGFAHARTPYLLCVPCDTPRLPLDLAERLSTALLKEDAEMVMAAAPQVQADGCIEIRPQPVFCLMKVSLADSLAKFTQAGGRKVGAWAAQHKTALVPFDTPSDDPLAFANVNTLTELQALEGAAPSPSTR